MADHRGTIGAALLTCCAAFIIGAVTGAASHWGSGWVILLAALAALSLLGAILTLADTKLAKRAGARQSGEQEWKPPPMKPPHRGDALKRAIDANENRIPSDLTGHLRSLHEEGRRLRQTVKPDNPSLGNLIGQSMMFRYPNVELSLEESARRWSEKVRHQLTLSAPRRLPEWERCPALPSQPLLQMRLVGNGPALVAFLDARLGLLENLIADGRTT